MAVWFEDFNCALLRHQLGPMVQDHELTGVQGECGVRTSVVIAELDFVGTPVERFNDRADLPLNQSAARQVHGQGDYIKESRRARHLFIPLQTT
ncbi:MAG TPA: hypothetical protein VGA18_02725 [Rhodothermales bacterium]